jgi:hypothetical protein
MSMAASAGPGWRLMSCANGPSAATTLRAHGDGKGHVEGVVGRVVDGQADVERDVVRFQVAGGRRRYLSAEQRQCLPRPVRRPLALADLEPVGVADLMRQDVRYQEFLLAWVERL